jgi:hypothetical protein
VGVHTIMDMNLQCISVLSPHLSSPSLPLPSSTLDPIWVIVRVQDDESVLGLANQLSTITTQEADMESESTEADRTHEAAPNPFATPSYQEHPFGSGSMMTNPHSIPTGACLERLLLQNHPPSPSSGVDSTPHPPTPTGQENIATQLAPVTATADSTTHPCSITTRTVPNQNQLTGWNSSLDSHQDQSLEWNQQHPGTLSAGSNTALMEDSSSETNTT